jgi:hypothetical protein
MDLAEALELLSAGKSRLARTAMIEMTTKSSSKVKAERCAPETGGRVSLECIVPFIPFLME